jgi:hypothetical protein
LAPGGARRRARGLWMSQAPLRDLKKDEKYFFKVNTYLSYVVIFNYMENSNRLYEHCSYTPTSKKIRTRAKKCAKVKTVKIRQTGSGRKSASFTHLTLQPELGVTSCTREERFPWPPRCPPNLWINECFIDL